MLSALQAINERTHGLGEKLFDPCSSEITNTNDAEGFMWMVNCMLAAALRVPGLKLVSKGMFCAARPATSTLNSILDNGMLLNTFWSNVPESSAAICVSIMALAVLPYILHTSVYACLRVIRSGKQKTFEKSKKSCMNFCKYSV